MKFFLLFLNLTLSSQLWGALPSVEKAAFPEQVFSNREGPRTDALLVWQQGKLLLDRYGRGYNSEKKHVLWSISKSLTSLVFAIAEHKGLVSRQDSICKIDPEISNFSKAHCALKFENLLTWTSGLQWLEEYEKSERIKQASVVSLLYGEGHLDMGRFVLAHPFVTSPGESWRYSSGDTALLMSLMPKIYGRKDVHKVIDEELMEPLGIVDWTLETDAKGQGVGAAFFHMRPSDLLKVGQLVLGKGVYQGKRFFADSWWEFLSHPPDGYRKKRFDHKPGWIGGGSFWVNRVKEAQVEVTPWPTAPEDTVLGVGHWGQYLVIIPSMQVVAVRMGDTRDGSYKSQTLLRTLMEDLK